MTSKPYDYAYVWIWLPGEIIPVVAGKLTAHANQLIFNYGQSYLSRSNAIAIYGPELPLKMGALPLLPGMNMPSCIRDAAPDAWGRRVIINRKLGNQDISQIDELTYLLESGSDRIGALDFQLSPTDYEPRTSTNVPLDELLEAAERVEKGLPVSQGLGLALNYGTSIGGARPKALIEANDKKYIVKFLSISDLFSVVKAEYIAMRLAHLCGLHVAPVSLVKASNKDVLMIERFDRVRTADGWQRKAMVSALTMLELDEMMARYASYEDFAEIVRHRFDEARATLKELFQRITFNILCGNTDDHARNHAAFWDGKRLNLTPAYDICPQGRGNEATQAMLIVGSERMSQIAVCLKAASIFLLNQQEARAIVDHRIETITTHWNDVCYEADLNEIDKKLLWGRQFLNPFSLEFNPLTKFSR